MSAARLVGISILTLLVAAVVLAYTGRVPSGRALAVTSATRADHAPVSAPLTETSAASGDQLGPDAPSATSEDAEFDPASPPGLANRDTAQLRVTVLSASTLRPLPGASVEIEPHPQLRGHVRYGRAPDAPPLRWEAHTDEDGQCLLHVDYGVPLLVVARGGDGEDGRGSEPVRALVRAEEYDVRLLLPSGCRPCFCGRVVDSNGSPIGGASIRLAPRTGSSNRACAPLPEVVATTRPDGTFELDEASFLRHVAIVEAAGFSPDVVDLSRGYELLSRPRTVTLRPSGAVYGALRTANGDPAAGYALCVTARSTDPVRRWPFPEVDGWPSWRTSVRSDARGAFELLDLPAGVVLDLVLFRDATERYPQRHALELAPGERKALDLELVRRGSIAVHVATVDREPVADAKVRLITEPASPYDESHTIAAGSTDADGRIAFSPLPYGAYEVLVEAPATEPSLRASGRNVELDPTHESVELEVFLDQGYFLLGQVFDSRGRAVPFPDVWNVRDESQRTTGDVEGRFRLGPLRWGRHRVTACAAGPYRQARPKELRTDGTEARIELPPGDYVHGRVVSSLTGRPRRANVMLLSGSMFRGPGSGDREVQCDADGYFVFDHVVPSTYGIVAWTSDGLIGHAVSSGSVAEERARLTEVVLTEGATLKLRSEVPVVFDVHTQYRARFSGVLLPGQAVEQVVFPAGGSISWRRFDPEHLLSYRDGPREHRGVRPSPGEVVEVLLD